jgi:alpha-galactosidase
MCCGVLSSTEEQTNMAMWAMWAAPLEMGADLRSMPAASVAILQNAEVIAVGQDPLVYQVYQGRRVLNTNGLQVWQKRLAGDSVAVALFSAK